MNSIWKFLEFVSFHGSQPRGSWNQATVLVQGCGTLVVIAIALVTYWLFGAK